MFQLEGERSGGGGGGGGGGGEGGGGEWAAPNKHGTLCDQYLVHQ